MDGAAWTGLLVGALVGSAYAWSQAHSLRRLDETRRRGETPSLTAQVPAALGRLVVVAVVLGLMLVAPPEKINKWWLTASLAVSYSVPLFWRLRKSLGKNRTPE